MVNGVENVLDLHGNYIPKTKIVGDVEHVYDINAGDYVPASSEQQARKAVIGAGTSLWSKLKGSGS